jgi:alkylation response protein AidB-like acyl-CoA dehydrogenase
MWSELEQQIYETASEILGADAPLQSKWLHGLLDSRSFTIGAGTSEINKTLLAERGLGLPREPRP